MRTELKSIKKTVIARLYIVSLKNDARYIFVHNFEQSSSLICLIVFSFYLHIRVRLKELKRTTFSTKK